MALTFVVNQGLFDTMVANGDRPSKVTEFAASLDVESSLLGKCDLQPQHDHGLLDLMEYLNPYYAAPGRDGIHLRNRLW